MCRNVWIAFFKFFRVKIEYFVWINTFTLPSCYGRIRIRNLPISNPKSFILQLKSQSHIPAKMHQTFIIRMTLKLVGGAVKSQPNCRIISNEISICFLDWECIQFFLFEMQFWWLEVVMGGGCTSSCFKPCSLRIYTFSFFLICKNRRNEFNFLKSREGVIFEFLNSNCSYFFLNISILNIFFSLRVLKQVVIFRKNEWL